MDDSSWRKIDLEALAKGGLTERFNHALQDVLLNIANPNAEATKKRSVIVEVVLIPNEERDMANVGINVKTKLVPDKAVGTTFRVGVDAQGKGLVKEIFSGIPGQTYMDEEGNQLTDSGEKVIDLKRQKN
ncbi:replication terminator protein [Sporolactobacillus sp. KGMB 08714]|uniref:replication terminator protein n=1 Tax=Sporolactobacillus sp. KGMB 08714 TaxID=3064704 RepID=UPI002FBDFC2F